MLLYLIVAIVVIVYFVITRKYNYFKTKKVPHIKPRFLFGNYGELVLLKKSMPEIVQDICMQFPDEKFIGAYFFTEPVLIPVDPDIIKLIMTKDFYYFNGREVSEHNKKERSGLNLFATYGDHWKVLRQNMTPLFSSAKMKNMFHLIQKCSYIFEFMLDKEIISSENIEVRELTAKFTVECIAGCAFGIDANTMTENPQTNPFTKIASSIASFPKTFFFKRLFRSLWPNIFYSLGFNVLEKQINFFDNLITSVMSGRNYTSSGRNDFVDLILSWKQNNQIIGDSLKSNQTTVAEPKVILKADNALLVAQCFIFFTAGFETSSTTLSYILYELAKHQFIQEKVLKEVDLYLIRHENKLDYECVNELLYLDAVIAETLRVYPVLGVIVRELMHDYTLPNGIHIKKGLRVHIPVHYLHHNPKYHPEPEEFHPERFMGEAKSKIIPYTYMPFGEGPRTCIGQRFAKMQMMAGLITILKKYRLQLAADTPRKLKFKPESFITHPITQIKLKFIERDGWENRVFIQ